MPWPTPKPSPPPPTVVIGRDLPHGSAASPNPLFDASESRPASLSRPIVEFLALVLAMVLVGRVFIAEAYIVPTGSMAPTLLGAHRDLFCPNCDLRFALGLIDGTEPDGRPVCPNCGHADFANALAIDSPGDRLLVQKHTFAWRKPRRWEVVVFAGADPDDHEAFVKRIVGLPGEAVQIIDGDLWIDGRLARKSLAEVHALRLPVYDHSRPPDDYDLYPRWQPLHGDNPADDPPPSGWTRDDATWNRTPTPADAPHRVDWLDYRHWEPESLRPGPIRDFVAYNGVGNSGEHRVRDLILECDLATRPDCPAIELALQSGRDRIRVSLPIDDQRPPTITLDDQPLPVSMLVPSLQSSPADAPRWYKIEASLVDRRLLIAIDGRLAFNPVDLDPTPVTQPPTPRIAIGLEAGTATLRNLRVFRDVYYTSELVGTMQPPHAVEKPHRLGPNEYFVLGDNSPVSNDSRFWGHGPVVPASTLVGRPFLVHVPSQVVPVRLFGRTLFWIPDPSEIRYIR